MTSCTQSKWWNSQDNETIHIISFSFHHLPLSLFLFHSFITFLTLFSSYSFLHVFIKNSYIDVCREVVVVVEEEEYEEEEDIFN